MRAGWVFQFDDCSFRGASQPYTELKVNVPKHLGTIRTFHASRFIHVATHNFTTKVGVSGANLSATKHLENIKNE